MGTKALICCDLRVRTPEPYTRIVWHPVHLVEPSKKTASPKLIRGFRGRANARSTEFDSRVPGVDLPACYSRHSFVCLTFSQAIDAVIPASKPDGEKGAIVRRENQRRQTHCTSRIRQRCLTQKTVRHRCVVLGGQGRCFPVSDLLESAGDGSTVSVLGLFRTSSHWSMSNIMLNALVAHRSSSRYLSFEPQCVHDWHTGAVAEELVQCHLDNRLVVLAGQSRMRVRSLPAGVG